jgi:hypothetical protein
MNSTPWNQREPTIEQEIRFQKITLLHTLTDAWVKAITPQGDRPHQMERMTRITLNQNLWLYEKARLDELPLELSKLVGSQSIDSFLNDLSDTAWIIQASTLENALSQTKKPDELISVLQKTSWNHGKNRAQETWRGAEMDSLSRAYDAFFESHPYAPNALLQEQFTANQIRFFWKQSPFQNKSLNGQSIVSALVNLHVEWIRGYFYSLSRKIRVDQELSDLNGSKVPLFTLHASY